MQSSTSSSKPKIHPKDIQAKFLEYKRLAAVNREIRQRAKTRTPQVLTNGERQQIDDNWKIIDKLSDELESYQIAPS
jgi:hypothetical protein